LPFVSNVIIESLDLGEIILYGRQFTWANREILQLLRNWVESWRVEWEHKFMLVFVGALTHSDSGHTPLLIDSGHHTNIGNSARYSFELFRLRQDGFYDMLPAERTAITCGDTDILQCQNKIRHLWHFLKGWGK
jgi:hypothetical protein